MVYNEYLIGLRELFNDPRQVYSWSVIFTTKSFNFSQHYQHQQTIPPYLYQFAHSLKNIIEINFKSNFISIFSRWSVFCMKSLTNCDINISGVFLVWYSCLERTFFSQHLLIYTRFLTHSTWKIILWILPNRTGYNAKQLWNNSINFNSF